MRPFVILHFLFLLSCPVSRLSSDTTDLQSVLKAFWEYSLLHHPNPSSLHLPQQFRGSNLKKKKKSHFATNPCCFFLSPPSDPPLPPLSLPPDVSSGVARRGGGEAGGFGSPSPRSSGGGSIRSLGLGGSISRRSTIKENSVELQEEDPRSLSHSACSSPLDPRGEAYAYSPDE